VHFVVNDIISFAYYIMIPSVLWRCWLGIRMWCWCGYVSGV